MHGAPGRIVLFALALCLAPLLSAQPLPRGAEAFDAARLAAIKPRMQQFVDAHQMPGAVTLIVHRGKVAHLEAVGLANLESKTPMRTDTIFQIMSMTKPFTGVGIAMLMEEGKLSLSDPVERHLPEFRNQWMVESRDGDARMVLRRPSRKITILDLMTHTSGMAGFMPEGIPDFMRTMDRPLSEAVAAYAQVPLQFEPGSRWMYSNMGIDTLGRIIEVCSGMTFEDFLAARLFQPLGMKDSFFYPMKESAAKRDRIAMVYRRTDDGLVRSGAEILGGNPARFREGARYPGPSFGLFSTAEDLALFAQMMLNGGTLHGKRYLSADTVTLMRTIQNGHMEPSGHNTGQGYGLTWTVAKDARFAVHHRPVGVFGHGGAFGTDYWIDPHHQLVGIFLTAVANSQRYEEKALSQMAISALREPETAP
ncbi:MAG: beta-lactamase family protein [Bryobacterales bacterium]|jgi:CubicO group peptidase (beta-lactamase class C family)|nr:beta-lactamase family protein [Bryobacterales bacterium]